MQHKTRGGPGYIIHGLSSDTPTVFMLIVLKAIATLQQLYASISESSPILWTPSERSKG